jgi:hypothetical protein
METSESIREIISRNTKVISNEKPKFGWYKDGHDVILNLGRMRKALVVRKTLTGTYMLSEGSYFPLPKRLYDERFNDRDLAMREGTAVILAWLSDMYNFLEI